MIPTEKLPKLVKLHHGLPVKEHLCLTTSGEEQGTQGRVELALKDWATRHDGILGSSWASPERLKGLIDIYLSPDTPAHALEELKGMLLPLVPHGEMSIRHVPSSVRFTLTGLRYEGDTFTFTLAAIDGQPVQAEFGTPDNKQHPKRLVEWSALKNDPHTVCFIYHEAGTEYHEGFCTHVADLTLLDLLREPAQPA